MSTHNGSKGFEIMNSGIGNDNRVDFWSVAICIFCERKIIRDSKMLTCLHIICEDCIQSKITDSGIKCKCKILTEGELINYPIIMLPNQTQVCREKNCQDIARKICINCKNMYCTPCSKTHSIKNEDHSHALMVTYPIEKEFVPCPKCMKKCVEVFCTKCTIMTCSLCYLKYHEKHKKKIISTIATGKLLPDDSSFEIINSNIDNDDMHIDIWEIAKCIFCYTKILENSKILKCLHIVCKDCTWKELIPLSGKISGIRCKCKIVSKGELIDYSIMLPNRSQVCREKNCQDIAREICIDCKNMYCSPCSRTHSIKNEDHDYALMATYPIEKEFFPCPKCMEKYVEIFCTKCSIMICSLCHLKFHGKHDYKILSIVATETKAESEKLLFDTRLIKPGGSDGMSVPGTSKSVKRKFGV